MAGRASDVPQSDQSHVCCVTDLYRNAADWFWRVSRSLNANKIYIHLCSGLAGVTAGRLLILQMVSDPPPQPVNRRPRILSLSHKLAFHVCRSSRCSRRVNVRLFEESPSFKSPSGARPGRGGGCMCDSRSSSRRPFSSPIFANRCVEVF